MKSGACCVWNLELSVTVIFIAMNNGNVHVSRAKHMLYVCKVWISQAEITFPSFCSDINTDLVRSGTQVLKKLFLMKTHLFA